MTPIKRFCIDDWRHFFPFEKIRPEQEAAINFILDSFLIENKKFCICEMGTGTGKSATAITVARYLNQDSSQSKSTGSYVLTTQKILQEQYVNDFGKDRNLLKSIKSSSNYQCKFYTDQSCGSSRRVLTSLGKNIQGTEFYKTCKSSCRYFCEKQDFIQSPIGITNFSYFLAETMYAKSLTPRSLLVIDECHNIENELGKFIEVTFSEKFSKEVLKCKFPIFGQEKPSINVAFNWVTKTYKPALVKHISKLEKSLRKEIKQGMAIFAEQSKQYEMLDKHICKINRFIEKFNDKNWIINVIQTSAKSGKKIEFKPIDVSYYGDELLYQYGEKVLMLSATIVDKNTFCETIGISKTDVAYTSIPSPFSVKNKPIHRLYVGKMSISNIDETLPKMSKIITLLLEKHENEKGIIHCGNYKIAKFLYENIQSNRLLIHDSNTRDEILKKHATSTGPTVILSPSMIEGVNLSDELSRFQIICKVPFPYLGDEVIRKRKENNRNWYVFQTAKSIIQAVGRSIRNENDFAVSYILDEDWDYFYKSNKNLFPIDFIDSLV